MNLSHCPNHTFPGLTAKLYGYQKKAVAWMCWRESLSFPLGEGTTVGSLDLPPPPALGASAGTLAPPHPPDRFHDESLLGIMWRRLRLNPWVAETDRQPESPEGPSGGPSSGQQRQRQRHSHVVFINVADGRVSLSRPPSPVRPLVPGGLLCEEMVSVGAFCMMTLCIKGFCKE